MRSRRMVSEKYVVDEERDRWKKRFIEFPQAKPGAGSASLIIFGIAVKSRFIGLSFECDYTRFLTVLGIV